MTKVVKWWKRYSVYQKIKIALIPLAVGGEVVVYFGDVHGGWFFVPPIAAYVVYLISNLIKDENKNNIVDDFET